MAEVEFEKFEITDYDLENEFNPNRRRRKLTKNQQIYGTFLSDESDNEGPSYSRKDYTTPVSFVGGGVQQSGKKTEEKKESESEASSDDDVIVTKPTKKKEYRSMGSMGGQRFSGLNASADDDFGKWEKYTKGIGLKLLLQQGYKPGKGLGKELQGISQPVQAKLRKGRGAIGAYGSENLQQKLRPSELSLENEGHKLQDSKNRSGQWKKSDEGHRRKVKYAYKTIDEVIAEGSQRKIATDISRLSKVKVIDMTGPEQRVLSGYHAIHVQHSKPVDTETEKGNKTSANFVLPELMHNLNILVEQTEQQIVKNGRALEYEKDQIVNMQHEEENSLETIAIEKKQIFALEKLVDVLNKFDSQSGNLTLGEAATVIREIQDQFYEEYKMYEISDLAVAIASPLFKSFFESWKPLENPTYGITEAKEWKDLLDNPSLSKSYSQDKTEKAEPYDQLILEAWMRPVSNAILNWNCRNCNTLIELILIWMPVLPPCITDHVLKDVILPRLHQEVDNWNPLTDHVPIDSWIHPWMPLMGNYLEIFYPTILHKLASGLTNWHPSDCTAKRILEPWKNVLSQGTLEAFLVKNVLPKLADTLQQFAINPIQQHLEPWHWVMAWEDMMPTSSMVSILETNFFPKWMQVLCTWLGHNPNYEEVTNWYTGWKSMIPTSIMAHHNIKEFFNRALDVMNHAVSGPQGMGFTIPGPQEHLAYLENLNRRKQMESQLSNKNYQLPSQPSNVSMTFKDLVEKRALENGLLFMPATNRFYEAKQVYIFGNQHISIDKSVIFVQREGTTWVPTSLMALVEMAK